ncbi:MAG TPA: phenylalanine--tRNA ligase subunit beta [Kouleothrix sp.]|uniref:phenylalanine--tRNA ligase subunit beta n=1 Tax=Kouleothrix sp. TaxID=2779161 RepID=UPI002B64ACCB|nr:phenylalanine--tRNA ligase subunit beta [Kouleothrix sp.]
MKVPISWLREFVDIDMPIDALAQKLTLSGLEVADVTRIGVPGAELAWDPEKIVIGNILEVRQHPNADRLVLAEVDYGAAEPHTVVTGAPNLFQYRGLGRLPHPLKGVYAKEGAELYDGHAEGKVKVKLKGRPVRGVMSDAMLCSEKELGMSDEHEGIIILPDDAPVGTPLRDYLGDEVLEIDILPNTARALSILGVAREVAALTGARLHIPEVTIAATGPSIEGRAQVTVEEPDLCPRFSATLIEGIEIKPSPLWMQRRLTLAGMRPIYNIVDVSNYVMLELGQPNHTYDADKVAGQHLIVRLARPGERITTLDGKQHEVYPVPGTDLPALLVCDPSGPNGGVAGVMGGAATEVSETTTRVLLEAANWEPRIIRKMARGFKLPSEASRRFERGVDLELAPLAQRRALQLFQQVAGGTIAQGMIDVYSRPWVPPVLDLTPREVRRILGIGLSASEIAELLRPLGFGCEVLPEAVRVTVPSYRQDVSILADLCEEVARMYGYDRIPTTHLADDLPEQAANPSLELEEKVRDVLVGAGLDEAITYSLTNMAAVARVAPADASPALYLKLANPITPEREFLRRSGLPTLLEALAQNLRERERVLLFEIGRVYLRREGAALPDQPRVLTLAIAGERERRSWLTPRPEPFDFFDLKGVIETLLARLNLADQVRFTPLTDDPRFHPGRAARLELAQPQGKDAKRTADRQQPNAQLGVLGELHPEARDRLEIDATRALAAELDLETLIAMAQPTKYKAISRFPATTQDLAVIVAAEVPADQVAAAIRKYAGPDLEALELFDVYEGQQVGAGKRSLAYRLAFRSAARTLSDADVNKVRAKIVRGLEFDLKATIRA